MQNPKQASPHLAKAVLVTPPRSQAPLFHNDDGVGGFGLRASGFGIRISPATRFCKTMTLAPG